MEMGLIAVAAAALLLVIWLSVAASRKTSGQLSSPVLPPGVTITSTPLLTETDVTFYNLMRLAVQDHFLVFTQVPLWSFVSVDAMGKAPVRGKGILPPT